MRFTRCTMPPARHKKNLYVNKALENLLNSYKDSLWYEGGSVRIVGIRGKSRVRGVFSEVVRILNTL